MAKALEIYFSSLTPLQQLAVQRIRGFQRELREEYGVYVRSAMELEFMAEGVDGRPIPHAIQLDRAMDYIRSEGVPYVEKFGYEHVSPLTGEVSNPAQYEINVADDAQAAHDLNPANIAAVTEHLKIHTLPQMLKNTSCLTPGVSDVSANFMARPYHDLCRFSRFDQDHRAETSALHVNISLYDKHGNNLLGASDNLLHNCATTLMYLQPVTALAVMPNENSLSHMNASAFAPCHIGVHMGKSRSGQASYSINIRKDYRHANNLPGLLDGTRIENRLPGADADPFISMAVTLGAMVEAVRKAAPHIHRDATGKVSVDINLPIIEKNPQRIAVTHDKLSKTFAQSKEARELLGSGLHRAIMQEYGSHFAVAV